MNIKNEARFLGALLAIALALLVSLGDASAADAPAKVARVGYLTAGTFLPGGGHR